MVPKIPERHSDKNGQKPTGGPEGRAHQAQPEQAPVARERRASHRVADDQKSGQGSLSAMSKMQMIERRRAAVTPRYKEPGEDTSS